MADPHVINRFNTYHSVFMTRLSELNKKVIDKAYATYALGRMIAAYECMACPIPAEINQKYNEATMAAAKANLP